MQECDDGRPQILSHYEHLGCMACTLESHVLVTVLDDDRLPLHRVEYVGMALQ